MVAHPVARAADRHRAKLFALLSPFAKLVHDPESAPAAFLESFTTTTVGILSLANLQDILSGGTKEAIDALIATPGSPSAFAAGCALATSLDAAGWNLFPTAILPLVLTATARYVAQDDAATPEFGEIAPAANSLALLARLAWSGRLHPSAQSSGAAMKIWERTVGPICEAKIKSWATAYAQGDVPEAQVCAYLRAELRPRSN